MVQRIAFEGMFRPSPRQSVVPGAWYLGFHCAACGKQIGVFDDPTSSGVVEVGGPADFELQCPKCGETRMYPARAMISWQATTGSPSGLD